jgi:hypothetical protein
MWIFCICNISNMLLHVTISMSINSLMLIVDAPLQKQNKWNTENQHNPTMKYLYKYI